MLIVVLFNMVINDTEDGLNETAFDWHNETITHKAYSKYWGMKYTSKNIGNDVAEISLELINYKSTRKNGRKLHELKNLWFKKLDQLLVIYEYMKISRYNAGYDYYENHWLLQRVSKTELKTQIEKIKAALNAYFTS